MQHNKSTVTDNDAAQILETEVGSLLNLEGAHQKHGHFDEKVFHSDDKITYTFLDNDEVIALHFDKERGSLFLKGHKIEKSDVTQQIQKYLNVFHQVILQNVNAPELVAEFEKSLAEVL